VTEEPAADVNFLFALLQALGIVTRVVERHVTDTGDDRDDGSVAAPYKTITRALQDAAGRSAGQRLVIAVSGAKPFVEPLLALPSEVSIKGPAEIRARDAGPAVTIVGTAATRRANVELVNLNIAGKGPYTGDGGAVLVDRADGVTLDGCELHDSVAGRGGALAVLNSTEVTVTGCKFHDNTAGTPATTMAGADIAPSVTLPTGNGQGGGIFVRDSDVEILECDVTENQAILFGGGVAISNDQRFDSLVAVVDCQVTCNQVSHPDLATLWAPATCARPDMNDPVRDAFRDTLVSGEDEAKLVALLHGMNFESGLGGGIGVRFASDKTRIARCKIGVTRGGAEGANRARRGGGISLYIGASPRIENNEIANNIAGGDGGGICVDLFDPILPPPETSKFGARAITMLTRKPTFITGNRIHDNHALEDGGGLYATGAARIELEGGVVERNRAGENGGGLRVTYATHLHAEGVIIRDNRANVLPAGVLGGAAVGAGDREGGGGVAARNAIVHLENCELTGNVSNSFAGAAVYFVSAWEGGFDGVAIPSPVVNARSRFDMIMEGPFAFHTRVLRIVNCRGSGNKALGDSGAGGFVYAIRSPTLGGVEPLWVSIEGAGTAIGANESHHDTPTGAGRKRGNVVIELSGRLAAGGPLPEDRVYVSGEIPAGGIAASTPAPNDRAVVVMIDATPANDVVRATWTGAELVHGPTPTATAVAPALASTLGGTTLRVTGTGIEDGTIVRIGAKDATHVSHTPTEITVKSPSGPAGPADVTVIGPAGPRARLSPGVRLLAPPTIKTLVPATGAAGANVKLTGTSLVPGTKVHLISGTSETEAVVVTAVTETELTFLAPPAPGAAPVDVRVTTPTGDTAVKAGGFAYVP
jgi:hypothetical protein